MPYCKFRSKISKVNPIIMRSFATIFKVNQYAARTFRSQRLFSSSIFRNTADTGAPAKSEVVNDIKSIQHLKDNNIVHSVITDGLTKLGFTNLTLVQSKTIEPILSSSEDIVTKAKTGTGKTLAFGIPLIEQILKNPKSNPKVRSLIIAPTRDLAFQIRDELNKLANMKEIRTASKNRVEVATAVGGAPRFAQIRDITNRRGCPSIVVATPGRFMDLIQVPDVRDAFANIETLVLDEADRLLGDGFKEELVEISDLLKEVREKSTISDLPPMKTMLFSATMDKPIIEFSKRILRETFQFIDTVDPNEQETHEKIAQSLILTNNTFESYSAAINFIQVESKQNKNFKAIVFLSTVKGVAYFHDIMSNYLRENNHGLRTYQLHGQLRQNVRDRAVKNFKTSFSGILVASDVGARGMDFPNVSNVIQIGLPMDATNYVHRVGRTARGGSTGKAVMILSKAESRFLRSLKNRGLVISDQYEYVAEEKVEVQLPEISARVPHKFSFDVVIESLAGFGKSVSGNYRLDMYEILDDLRDTYARMMNDENAKPPVSSRYASNVLGLNRRAAEEFFNVDGVQAQSTNSDNDDFYVRGGDRDGNRGGNYQRRDRSDGGRNGYQKRDGGNRYNDRRDGNRYNDRRDGNSYNRDGRNNRSFESKRGRGNRF